MLICSETSEGDSQEVPLDDTVNLSMLRLFRNVLQDLYNALLVGSGCNQFRTRSVKYDFKSSCIMCDEFHQVPPKWKNP